MLRRIRWELQYQAHKRLERLQMWVAWHSPRWLVRWTVVRAFAQASRFAGDKHPDEIGYNAVAKAVDTL